jgi:hypothetical protein
MSGSIPPLSQYAFMAWCSVKTPGQLYLYLYLYVIVYELRWSFWTNEVRWKRFVVMED